VRAVLPKVARLNEVVLSTEQKGWWDVTNDLYSRMADSELTPSQIHNLKNKYDGANVGATNSYPPGEYLVQRIGYRKSSIQIVSKDKPSPTIIASFTNDRKQTGSQKRLFEEYLRKTFQVSSEAELKKTAAITAWPVHLEKGSARNNFYNWATVHEDGEITSKNVNMPFLARLQGFPDNYSWNGDIRWDGEMIGNAVPPPMMKALVESIKWI
jgi:site-specific DNA-cytosine methylase